MALSLVVPDLLGSPCPLDCWLQGTGCREVASNSLAFRVHGTGYREVFVSWTLLLYKYDQS